jgi:NTE family protein
MNVGLALSGGGFRATVFHLGVLARLADENRLEQVTVLSTVSGGSLSGALVYANNNFAWPTSHQFIDQVLPQARALLLTQDLQLGLLWRALRSPLTLFEPRANLLSALLQERWGVTAKLDSIPKSPRWLINTTCYETGKNWRFESFRMGDYGFGYSNDTDIPVSDAVAASSGFPGLIGALVLDTQRFNWFRYVEPSPDPSLILNANHSSQNKTESFIPGFRQVHLWDGGVYDNFGLEGVVDVDRGWRKDIDLLIVSDAAGRLRPGEYQPGVNALVRMITDIMMDQVHALRTRALMERIHQGDPGVLLKTGNTCENVLRNSEHADETTRVGAQCLDSTQAARVENFATTINRLSPDDFELLFRHGYEVADYTLYAYAGGKFIGYANSPSSKIVALTNT